MLVNPSIPWHDQVISQSKVVDNHVNLVILSKEQQRTLSLLKTGDDVQWCEIIEAYNGVTGHLVSMITHRHCTNTKIFMMCHTTLFQPAKEYELLKWHYFRLPWHDGGNHNHSLWIFSIMYPPDEFLNDKWKLWKISESDELIEYPQMERASSAIVLYQKTDK